MISKTLGIPGGKLLDASDIFDDVKVFQAFKDDYIGDVSPLEELRLKWLELAKADPDLEARTERLPDGISVSKKGTPKGVFICRRVPTLTKSDDDNESSWSLTPGRVEWAVKTDEEIERGPLTIDHGIHASVNTPAANFTERGAVRTALREFERAETKRLRKEVQLPLDAPTPETLCWMEIV